MVWLTSERVTQQGLSLILFAVLAPILGPRPYGLFALVMVFVGFCEAILLDGAVEALVTVDDLHHLHTTAANLTNGLMALMLGLAMFASAPAIAAAMHDAEFRNVMWALALMPVLSTLSAAPIAVLRRSLKFKQLAIRSILGLTIGGVFGIVLAVEGAGVWALVLQVLAQRIAELVIGWIAVPVRFRPHLVGSAFPRTPSGRPECFHRTHNGDGERAIAAPRAGLYAGADGCRPVRSRQPLSRYHRHDDGVAADCGGSDRATRGEDRLCGIPTRFRKDGAERIHPVVPIFPGNGGACAGPVSSMAQTTMAGRHCSCAAYRPQRRANGVVFQFRRGAAGGQSLIRRPEDRHASRLVTVAATVLCAAPFGLIATCLALAVRPWLLLPVVFMIFRRATNIPGRIALLPSLRALIGADRHGRAHKFTLFASDLDERRS